jgi:hypothetical protein
MTVHQNVGFQSRPRSMDWTAATILVGSVFAAMALLVAI